MMMEFTIKADTAQPVLVVVNNVNVNFISPAETEVFVVRADALREKTETAEEKTNTEPQTETGTEE